MNSNIGSRVIHLVPPNGGGVDRCVRDLYDRRPADWLLHVSDGQVVIEARQNQLMAPVALDKLTALVGEGVLGRAAALHAHSTVPAVRAVTDLLAKAMDLRFVVTLHDVEFAGGPEAQDPVERDRRMEFIRAAASCTVPSAFIRDRVLEVLGPSFACMVVENGVDPLGSTPAQRTAQRFPVAVIGAMGQHKGLAHLIEVATLLPSDQGIVLLGYADGQLAPGWLADGRIRVHGAFEPAQLPELVARYASVLSFFPKGQPESYCYALSDAWLAGLPVVAPDSGAIGERVRTYGGGTLYHPNAAPEDVARDLSRALSEPPVSVVRAVRGLASISTMVHSMSNIYSGIAVPESAPDPDALRRSAAIHLDSRFFRRELLRMQGDLVATTEQRDNVLKELHSLAENFRERGEWIERLQQDQESLRQGWDSVRQQLRQQLQQQASEMQASIAQLEAAQAQAQDRLERQLREHAQLQHAHEGLAARHATLVGRLTWPLQLLPFSWQAWIKKTARRMLVGGENNG